MMDPRLLLAAAWSMFPGLLGAQDGIIVREGVYWVETVRGECPGSAPARLRIASQGAVTLRSGPDKGVRYVLKRRVQARNPMEARSRLRMVRVKSQREGSLLKLELLSSNELGSSADLWVNAPSSVHWSAVQTAAGSVSVLGMDGFVSVITGAGRIGLDRIGGECSARSGGGDLQIGYIGGPLQCFTAGGAIRVLSTGGATKLETAGGDIFVQEAKGPVTAVTGGGNIRVGRAASSVSARTLAGLIEVNDAGGPVIADNSGGVIEINSSHGAQCASSAGAIRLKNVVGNLQASAHSGSILAELLAGRPFSDSTLSANLGDVTVMIPSSIAMTVMARNESGGAIGRIFSEFREIRVRAADSGAFGPTIAHGLLNGGGPVLHINVAGGNIYLRRRQ